MLHKSILIRNFGKMGGEFFLNSILILLALQIQNKNNMT